MKTNHYLSAALLLLWGAASCTNDDSVDYASDPSAVRIAASVGANSIFSRSNPTGGATEQAAFNAGDAIAIAADDDQTAVRYVKGEGDAWAPATSTSFLRWTADAMTFKAYYPVVDGASMTTFTVPTDQTTVDKIAKADYMTFSGSKSKPATAGEGISIEMQRQMARVILNVTFKDQFSNTETLSEVTVASPADLTKAATARIQPYSSVAKNYVAIVIPGMASGTADFVTLTVAGKQLTAKLTQTIDAGKSYTFGLTVGKNLLTVSNVTVSDWSNTATITGGEAVWEGVYYIAYTTSDNKPLTPYASGAFASIYNAAKSTYANGQGRLALNELVTTIGAKAFRNCSTLTSITLPESVTSIGNYAFENCSALTTIAIPEGVTTIGGSVFSNCTSLTTITIPEGVTTIGSNAFDNCSALTAITIPKGVTSIGKEAFSGCNVLAEMTVDENNPTYDSRDNCNAIIEKATDKLVVGTKATKIPESVTTIGESAFKACYSLTTITIPESVMTIGSYAFMDCSGLTTIAIPASVTSIGGMVFSGCNDLATIKVDDNNPTYDSREDCNAIIKTSNSWLIAGIKTTRIPSTVTVIGAYAFQFCSDMTTITIPEGVKGISNMAFYGCSGLTAITIPNSVITINMSAFATCSNLASITIGKGVQTIDTTAFSKCTSLASITLPESVKWINQGAFYECEKLQSVYCEGTTPAGLGTSVFGNTHADLKIYVPSASVDAYKAADVWSTYASKIEAQPAE